MRYTSCCLLVLLQSWVNSYVIVVPLTSSWLSSSSFNYDNTIFCSSNKNNYASSLKYYVQNRRYSVNVKGLVAAKDSDDSDDFFDDYDEFISNFNVEDQPDHYYPNESVGNGNNRGYNDNKRGGNNYRNNRGGGGRNKNSSHDYQRSPDDDVSNDSPGFASTINGLIAERLEYRKTGQFDDADAIRDELKDAYGVTVWDRERIWTTTRQSTPQRRGPSRFNDRKPRRKERDFGPNGHDYELDPANQALSKDEMDKLLPEVNSLIAERLQCKLNRDFRTADAIQDDLRSNYNVEVHDGFKSFRFFAEGEGVYNDRPSQKKGRRDNKVRQYRMRGTITDDNPLDVELIQGLVQKRAVAKSERNYDLADQVREELKHKYDVVVDDRSGEWSLSTQQYLLVGSSSGVSNEIIHEIQVSLAERMEAKKNSDYQTADDIRDDLNAKYGVSIYDDSKEFEIEFTQGLDLDGNTEQNGLDSDANEEDIDTDYVDCEEDDEKDMNDDDEVVSTRPELESLTVPILKEKLRALELPISGRKSELIDRILGVE